MRNWVSFFDDKENVVGFSGSANESKTALTGNFESMDVYTSSRGSVRAQDKIRYFERLWVDNDPGADVYTISEAAKKSIWIYERNIIEQESSASNKWRHQEEAVEKFLVAKRGVLNVATGTGKTRTAIFP